MIADWTVDISTLSPSIDVPWEGWADLFYDGADAGPWDEAAAQALPECQQYPEFVPLLALLNLRYTATSKLDMFPIASDEVDPEIAEQGASSTSHGLGSYVDVYSYQSSVLRSFDDYEQIARRTIAKLRAMDTYQRCLVEIVVRPARIFEQETFGWTLYAMGFGETEAEAREQWLTACKLLIPFFGLEVTYFLGDAVLVRKPEAIG